MYAVSTPKTRLVLSEKGKPRTHIDIILAKYNYFNSHDLILSRFFQLRNCFIYVAYLFFLLFVLLSAAAAVGWLVWVFRTMDKREIELEKGKFVKVSDFHLNVDS